MSQMVWEPLAGRPGPPGGACGAQGCIDRVCPWQVGLALAALVSMVTAGQRSGRGGSSGAPTGSNPGCTPSSLYDFE